MDLTPQRLLAYAQGAHKRLHRTGYATVRQAARALRVTQQQVLDLTEEAEGFGLPISLSVGIQIGGGGGSRSHDAIGDYELEVWEE